ncbi:MAG TPA: molybdopterin cofactor-binding domain-containing protein, partial [Steroidobacteraceae bacterium]|nr:molybdopterin cofactor-binding domain-containing protein [Steroidobacteraceae bacterium]
SGSPLPKGRGRGIAVAEAFNTFVAQVAEVSVDDGGQVKVDRVVCAVDCGTPINPDIISAQMEGGIGFGLGAALYGAITLKDGHVEQSNFNSYRVLRMNEMPKVEVHIVPSTEAPTGVGEPGVAPVGPAVANAIFAATGRRAHVFPLVKGSA